MVVYVNERTTVMQQCKVVMIRGMQQKYLQTQVEIETQIAYENATNEDMVLTNEPSMGSKNERQTIIFLGATSRTICPVQEDTWLVCVGDMSCDDDAADDDEEDG